MNNAQRGKIRNKDYVPTKDFSGLRFGKITPTDIDGFLDFWNKVFVIIELKYSKSPIQFGQRLALERLCDACEDKRKRKCVILVARYAEQCEEVFVSSLAVDEIRSSGKWRKPNKELTVREAIDALLLWEPSPH